MKHRLIVRHPVAAAYLAFLSLVLLGCTKRGPSFYKLEAGQHRLSIPERCVDRLIGPPEAYKWTPEHKHFANFYILTAWPALKCVDRNEQFKLNTTPAGGSSIRFHTTWYGEHAREHLDTYFKFQLIGDVFLNPGKCHPMYREDGSWWPREGACASPYKLDQSKLEFIGKSDNITHYSHYNRNFYANNPNMYEPIDDLYLRGTVAAPVSIMICERAATAEVISAGAGRICRGAYERDGFVTEFMFSSKFVPIASVNKIQDGYENLISSFERTS